MQMEYIWWCASLVGYHLHVYIHIYIYAYIYIIIIYLYNISTNAEMYERGGSPPTIRRDKTNVRNVTRNRPGIGPCRTASIGPMRRIMATRSIMSGQPSLWCAPKITMFPFFK